MKIIERETSAASHAVVPAELLRSPVYAGLRRAYAKLADIVGPPPFTITHGKKRVRAETFEELRGEGARARQAGHAGQPLQGARRDERGRAARDDDGPGAAAC